MSGLLRSRAEIGRIARRWRFWSRAIAKAAVKVLGPCRVYVFGSVAEGRQTGGSDVDILIVVKDHYLDGRRRGELVAKIEEVAGLPLYHPFEIHLASEETVERNPIYRDAAARGVRVNRDTGTS